MATARMASRPLSKARLKRVSSALCGVCWYGVRTLCGLRALVTQAGLAVDDGGHLVRVRVRVRVGAVVRVRLGLG